MAAQFAVGMAMANQMMQQPGGILGQATPPVTGGAPATAPPGGPAAAPPGAPAAAAAPAAGMLALLGPAEAAQWLGVSESDVISALTAGDLKGKKIGTSWRIPKSALQEFLGS